ncbi:protein tesmin/TSO1-like CXC 3 isoform X2 [Hevea brasiliensis]|uniref:protein tesmin/TSO1-like CXC 3 isoform X2 n=1 Tax=Hevea brasiliensis TaxID=3981 RepID=UPI0025D5F2E9|nr:protein tesmin/TSO1-like CXC 3 isoform X2 [Hevea brasiliensis]
MELNTPNKNHLISTSLSQFEDSPVFNYINNLSPIELVKSVHSDQTFNSLAFSSPPSVFASPKLVSQRDTRSFITRRQLSDPLKPRPSQIRDDNNTSEGVSEAVELSNLSAEQLGCLASSSSPKDVTAEPLNEHLELAIELPEPLKCDSTSPDKSIVPLDAIRRDTAPEEVDKSNERHCLYESEKNLRKICRIDQSEDEAGGDWVTLISNVADALNFESSIIEEHSEEHKLMVDPGTISFISNVLQIPQDSTNDLENGESIVCDDYSEQKMGEPGSQSIVLGKKKEADEIPAILSGSLLNKLVVNDAAAEVDVKGKKRESSCKQNRIRRLVFEMAGAHKKESVCQENSTSPISGQSDCEVGHTAKYSTPRISMLSRRGIGLHLNAFATTSSDNKVVKTETSSTKQEMSLVPCDSEDQVTEDAPQILTVVRDEVGISSPKMKRHKIEHAGAACKRCNCKRSKCLKLYCECFAAGLYCIEPCSCQDCFNKPAHEETVLETRKQIESRNPLAFAPKVIRSTDFVSEFGDETNKTPASARHKRGCNCKKSSCLKKYCECFQGGVGCSPNCRCEGCKNTFGTKNGLDENELEGGESEVLEKKASDVTLCDRIESGEEEGADLPIPSETARSSIQLPMTFGGRLSRSLPAFGASSQMCPSQKHGKDIFRQPKFETHLQAIPEEETPEILTSSCPPANGVKSASPNGKRVSPPHQGFGSSAIWRCSRKLILRSVPPFPSLNSPRQQ